MGNVYNSIGRMYTEQHEINTALNIADALYYGSSCNYNYCDCGCTVERFNQIKKQVFNLICSEV